MWINICVYANVSVWLFHVDIRVRIYILHSHKLPYGDVPLYSVDFERPVSLKQGVIPSNFPEIVYDFRVRTALGPHDYEISLK